MSTYVNFYRCLKDLFQEHIQNISLLERRTNLGFYETLVQELRFEDELEYKKV